jgi:hypothetical protein
MTTGTLAELFVRRCRICGRTDDEVRFPSRGKVCNPCIAERSNAARKAKGRSGSTDAYARSLGITPEEYAEYKASACGICGLEPTDDKPNTAYANRQTGKVMGAICPKCVSGLGLFDHDPERVRRALDYMGGEDS